ncbi:MAG: DUF3047 domain-containing protein [Gammaproteobacteria bacterium]|nr:DUF3047 domain-containing protein [Gammaproteobacteria bacterium]
MVGPFSKANVQGWEEKSFRGHTEYIIKDDGGRSVLAANSNSAASGLFKKIDVDLESTPYLNWSWKIDHVLAAADERSKKGDDYPARVYVVFSSGPLFWKTRTLNYVWSSNQGVDAEWPNAYTASAHMIAVEGGREQVGQWRTYRRNVREDFKKYFGEDLTQASAIAIMTDTDNTGQDASALYGDIFFSSN